MDRQDTCSPNYYQQAAQIPLLTREEEVELAKRIQQGDMEARNALVSANLRLVMKIAYTYRNRGLDIGDLIAEGNLGLIKAAERFEPDRGSKFSSYAAFWIRQAISRGLANTSRGIRVPVHVGQKLGKIQEASKQLESELGREPDLEELSIATEIPINKLAHLLDITQSPVALDKPTLEGEGATMGELIPDTSQPSPP